MQARRTALVALWCLAGTGTCTCPGPATQGQDAAHPVVTTCLDADEDGYGPGCAAGPDCDDHNELLNTSCDCSTPRPGCPCGDAAVVACYTGPEGTLEVGTCIGGNSRCDAQTGQYGACEGQVIPIAESCNQHDDDCDGDVDNGVRSPCGDCNPDCIGHSAGPRTGTPFDPPDEDNASGVKLDPDGAIVIDADAHEARIDYLFIANDGEGTISKVDTAQLVEAARYPAALPVSGVATGVDARPSRTAIGPLGDVWVANRAHNEGGANHQGSVTKIAASGCVDKNGNGHIETSQDLDGDGVIDTSPGFVDPGGQDRLEYYGDADECVLFTKPVGGPGGIPRALAISGANELHPAGIVLVGTHAEQRFYALEGLTGELVAVSNNPIHIDLHPYGAAIDSQGTVWTTEQATDKVQAMRIVAGAIVKSQLFQHNGAARGVIGSYGIAVDEQDRIWTAGYNGTHGTGVFRFSPAAERSADGFPVAGTWDWVDPLAGTANAETHSRGVAVHRDAEGKTWLWAGITAGFVLVVDAETLAVKDVLQPPGNFHFIGVGPDFVMDPLLGVTHVWAISSTGDGADPNIGTAVRITYDYANGSASYHSVPVGRAPYTYSDFTGYGLRTFATRAGDYRMEVAGCPWGETTWDKLLWDVELPPGTQVCLRAVAEGGAASPPRCVTPPGGPGEMDISMLSGASVQIEVTLSNLSDDPEASPRILSLGVAFVCPPQG